MRAPRHLAAALACATVAAAGPAPAATDQQQTVDRARITIGQMRKDPAFGNSPELLKRARAVMIVPELIKGGFFFGGEGGTGVLLAKARDGSWSPPAFYTIAAASFGLQIGLETAEVVLFVMSDKALKAWMKDEIKLGAKAGVTVLMIGTNVEAAATTNVNADVIAWGKSKGIYGGITVEGSLIRPRSAWNEAYYGRPVAPRQIVIDRAVANKGADPLRATLAGY